MVTNIFVASDHGGLCMKDSIVNFLAYGCVGLNVADLGTNSLSPVDYPDVANTLCKAIPDDSASSEGRVFGILICRTGVGMSIAANRHKHIRAALCTNIDMARLARQHNNANVLCVGETLISNEGAHQIITEFLSFDFDMGRHTSRVAKLTNMCA